MKHPTTTFFKSENDLLSHPTPAENLSFANRLMLIDKFIALDEINRKVEVIGVGNAPERPYLIDLDNVTSLSVKSSYGGIRPGELRRRGFQEFLRRIDLQFKFRDSDEGYVLNFYNIDNDSLQNRPGLEKNARNWHAMLSGLIHSGHEKMDEEIVGLSFV